MKEILFVVVIFILFLILSFFFQNKMVQLKNKVLLIFSMISYFIAIDLFFDMLLNLTRYLKTVKIYFDFGHANLLLVLLYFTCMAGAIGFAINIFILRSKIKNQD